MSADLLFWYGLAIKMVLTAVVVVATSIAVERAGPFIGALIAALPTAASAAYIILAIEHPPAFIAASAVGSVAIGAAISIFCAAYTLSAQRHNLFTSLGIALLMFFVVAAVLRLFEWTALRAIALNIVVFAVTIPLCWRYRSFGVPRQFLRTAYDIPLRALAAAIVVAVVTSASYTIGSFASGMFALFPIILCSSIVILHPRVGGRATASMLAHTQVPLVGLALGFLVLHFLAEPLGSWPALAIGLSVCVAWNGLLLLIRTVTNRKKT